MIGQRAGLVHCGHLFMAPLVAHLAKLSGTPFILHLHGLELKGAPTPARQAAMRAAEKLICVSRDTADLAMAYGGVDRDRIAILPNRFAAAFIQPADRAVARAQFNLGAAPTLLTVSRLDAQQRHKGHERVLASLPALRERWPGVVYLVAGDGDDRPRLEALATKHGVAERVRFLGRVPVETLPALYGAADLFVMPSTGDGFGIAFVEAMACGTPALGLAVGGAVDALCPGELGFASMPDSFETDFADVLEQALAMEPAARKTLAVATYTRFGQPAFDARIKAIFDPLLPIKKAAA